MSDVSWQALALTLTACGGLWTWYALRNRSTASAVRGAGLSLLPAAAYFTGTLEMAGEIGSAVGRWATGFVFSPFVWLGIVLFAISVVLFGVSNRLAARGGAAKAAKPTRKQRRALRPSDRALGQPSAQSSTRRSSDRGAPAIDDDLADIEALLRKRGIN